MGTSRRATSQAGPSTHPPLVEVLVLLLDTTITLRSLAPPKTVMGDHVILYTLCPRGKAPTLLCYSTSVPRGTRRHGIPRSPNRLRHPMEIKLAVGPSSRRTSVGASIRVR